jgi:hypothetical protein
MHKFDEMYAQLPFIDSAVRPHYRSYLDWLKRQDPQTMRDRREEAEMIFRRVGITFAVYGDDSAGERIIPFDIVPRVFLAFAAGRTSPRPWSAGHRRRASRPRARASAWPERIRLGVRARLRPCGSCRSV